MTGFEPMTLQANNCHNSTTYCTQKGLLADKNRFRIAWPTILIKKWPKKVHTFFKMKFIFSRASYRQTKINFKTTFSDKLFNFLLLVFWPLIARESLLWPGNSAQHIPRTATWATALLLNLSAARRTKMASFSLGWKVSWASSRYTKMPREERAIHRANPFGSFLPAFSSTPITWS